MYIHTPALAPARNRAGDPSPVPPVPRGAVVTIGKFDGVHRGHRALLHEVRRQAAILGRPTVAVTFDRHPMAALRPQAVPATLTPLPHKVRLLRRAGIDHVVVLRFDRARAGQSPEEFVDEVLVDRLRACAVVVGADFRFGHRAAGDVELLRQLGTVAGFTVDAVAKVTLGANPTAIGTADAAPAANADADPPVSSTAIRARVAAGQLCQAGRMLGRRHLVAGTLAHHDGPAVVIDPECALPPPGRWAVAVHSRHGRLATGPARLEIVDDRPRLRPDGADRAWSTAPVGAVWATLTEAA